MNRKLNLKALCKRFADGGAALPADSLPPAAPVTAPAVAAAAPSQTTPDTEQTPPTTEPTAEKAFTKADIDSAVATAMERQKQEQENVKDYEKMSPEQKVAYLENAAKGRELSDFTAKHLGEQKVPVEFAGFLKGSDEATTKAHVATFKAAYEAAVQAGVLQRFKDSGHEPRTGSANPTFTANTGTDLASAVADALNFGK